MSLRNFLRQVLPNRRVSPDGLKLIPTRGPDRPGERREGHVSDRGYRSQGVLCVEGEDIYGQKEVIQICTND